MKNETIVQATAQECSRCEPIYRAGRPRTAAVRNNIWPAKKNLPEREEREWHVDITKIELRMEMRGI